MLAAKGGEAWRWMFGLGLIPSLLFLAGIFFLPESPRWYVNTGQFDKALLTFRKISSHQTADKLLEAVKNAAVKRSSEKAIKLFAKAVRPAVIIGATLAVFQQFCGINIVFNYTSTIFSSVGAGIDRQLWETVIIGIVNTLFTLIAMWQVDKVGRKPLIMYGSVILSICYLVLAILLKERAQPFLISITVLFAIAVYATSLAPVTWIIISEIFPSQIRGKASAFAILCLWGGYFLLVFTFPLLAEKIGTYGPFYLYAAICFCGFLFIKLKVKETKGQSLEEIETIFPVH
jgi:sugar porter (SP) family MFS transporter